MTTPGKEVELAQSRQKFMQESLLDPYKQRFGLFSYATLSVGDDSIGRRTKPHRDAEGAVIIEPKNLYTKRLRRGKTADVYFSSPTFATINDPYDKRISPKARAESVSAQSNSHEGPFKPGGPFNPGFAPYPHEASEVYKKKNYRDAEGAVKLAPKNILVRPPKLGQANSTPNLTFSHPQAITGEPYDRKRMLQIEERKRKEAKNLHEKAFRGISYGEKNFANHIQTFGKTAMPSRSTHRPVSVPIVQHDHPFKPANPPKHGIYDMTISRFPEYKLGQDGKKPPRPTTDDRKWKTTYKERTRPTPSIVSNPINLRTEFPSLKRLR